MTSQLPQTIALFGEVLMDQFPDGQCVLGGAPFNVAWHLQAFGLAPQFISRVGKDTPGESIRQAMIDWGMSDARLQIDTDHPTGTVKVTLNRHEPHYEILDHQAYDFISADAGTGTFDVFYHGTLATRNKVSAQTLKRLLRTHTGKVFIDVNLRTPWWHKEVVMAWLKQADWVKLNHEEFALLSPPYESLPTAMQDFLQAYRLDVLVVTCASEGAIALNNKGEFVKVIPDQPLGIVDTVGAGDAFAAVLLLGLQRGWLLSDTLARAQAFASAIVGQRGATVQDPVFYQHFTHAWQ